MVPNGFAPLQCVQLKITHTCGKDCQRAFCRLSVRIIVHSILTEPGQSSTKETKLLSRVKSWGKMTSRKSQMACPESRIECQSCGRMESVQGKSLPINLWHISARTRQRSLACTRAKAR